MQIGRNGSAGPQHSHQPKKISNPFRLGGLKKKPADQELQPLSRTGQSPFSQNCQPPLAKNNIVGQSVAAMQYPHPTVSFPTPGKTVPHHPLGDGHQVTVPHPPLGDHTPTVHAHLQAQKLQHKTKALSIGCVQRAANVRRPTP